MRFTTLQLVVVLASLGAVGIGLGLQLGLPSAQAVARDSSTLLDWDAVPLPGEGERTPVLAPVPPSPIPRLSAADLDQLAESNRIDVNQASTEELTQLRGVGPATARRIIQDRETNGPFLTLEDLTRVSGIGPKTVERLRSDATVGTGKVAPAPVSPARPPPERSVAELPEASRWTINVNQAGADELQRLPRIGPAMSRRIIEDREKNGPFLTLEELARVKGIGPKTVERLRPHIRLGDDP